MWLPNTGLEPLAPRDPPLPVPLGLAEEAVLLVEEAVLLVEEAVLLVVEAVLPVEVEVVVLLGETLHSPWE
jgi:hypothetical protein